MVRTERRGVIAVGPATTRRGDPLGLFSRDVAVDRRRRVPGPPAMVPLERSAPGCCATSRASRTTRSRRATSPSTRCVSTSPATTCATSTGAPRPRRWPRRRSQLLVRQFLDTRRSHARRRRRRLAAVRRRGRDDSRPRCRSRRRSSCARSPTTSRRRSSAGATRRPARGQRCALDAVCRAGLGRPAWSASANRAAQVAPDTSLLFLVTGAEAPSRRAAASALPAGGTPAARSWSTPGDRPGHRGRRAARAPPGHQGDLPGLLRWSVR